MGASAAPARPHQSLISSMSNPQILTRTPLHSGTLPRLSIVMVLGSIVLVLKPAAERQSMHMLSLYILPSTALP